MSRTPAVALAPGVWRIPTAGKDLINSFALVQEDGSVTLVDTGLKKAPPRIVAGLAARWAVAPREGAPGKTVWAELRLA